MFGHESYGINFAQARVGVAGQKLSAKYSHAPPRFPPAPGSQRFAVKQDRNVVSMCVLVCAQETGNALFCFVVL